MSAAYYDLYGEEGALFVVKLNILDKDGKSVNLLKNYTKNGQLVPLYIPEELKAIGVTKVTDIQVKLSLKPNLFDDEPIMFFTSDSSVYNGNDTIGKIQLKEGSQYNTSLDYNIILHRKMSQSIVASGIPTEIEVVDGGIGIGNPGNIYSSDPRLRNKFGVYDTKGTLYQFTLGRLYNDPDSTVHVYTAEKPYPYGYSGTSLGLGTQSGGICSTTVTSVKIINNPQNYEQDEKPAFTGSYNPAEYAQLMQMYGRFGAAIPLPEMRGKVPANNVSCFYSTSSARVLSFRIFPKESIWTTSDYSDKFSPPYQRNPADAAKRRPQYPFALDNAVGSKSIPLEATESKVKLAKGSKLIFPITPDLPSASSQAYYDVDLTKSCFIIMELSDVDYPKAIVPCYNQDGSYNSDCDSEVKYDFTTGRVEGVSYLLFTNKQGIVTKRLLKYNERFQAWRIGPGPIKVGDRLQQFNLQCDRSLCEQSEAWRISKCNATTTTSTGIATTCNLVFPNGSIKDYNSVTPTTEDPYCYNCWNNFTEIGRIGGENNAGVETPTDVGCKYKQLSMFTCGVSLPGSPVLPCPNPSESDSTCDMAGMNWFPYWYLSCDKNAPMVDKYTRNAAGEIDGTINEKCYQWRYKEEVKDFTTKVEKLDCTCNPEIYLSKSAYELKEGISFDITGEDQDLLQFKLPELKVSSVKQITQNVLGTHFYDLEFTFICEQGTLTNVAYTLRMMQGKFVITPEVTT